MILSQAQDCGSLFASCLFSACLKRQYNPQPEHRSPTSVINMILVTGATGFLGHNLIPLLVGHGRRVRAFVRSASDYGFLRECDVELAFGDVRNADAVYAAMTDCAAVIHAAGKFRFWGEPGEFASTNVEGTRNVLEAARCAGVRRFVHISTIAVVGNPKPGMLITEDTSCHPADDYQRSKLRGEQLALAYYAENGLPVIVLRPGAFYGPWGRYAFNRLFFEDPLKGLPLRVHHGQHVTFPIFVPDLCHTIESVLTTGRLHSQKNSAKSSWAFWLRSSRLTSAPVSRSSSPATAEGLHEVGAVLLGQVGHA